MDDHSTDTAELVALEHAQQLRLRRGIHFGDLVEKQRPSVGLLEAPPAGALCAGEGTAFVPEPLIVDGTTVVGRWRMTGTIRSISSRSTSSGWHKPAPNRPRRRSPDPSHRVSLSLVSYLIERRAASGGAGIAFGDRSD